MNNIELQPLNAEPAPVKKVNNIEKIKTYLQVAGLIFLLIIYFSLIVSGFIKFYVETGGIKYDAVNEIQNLNTILNSISKEAIHIQALSSDSEPITIINGTALTRPLH